jgi:hypothetical protein
VVAIKSPFPKDKAIAVPKPNTASINAIGDLIGATKGKKLLAGGRKDRGYLNQEMVF